MSARFHAQQPQNISLTPESAEVPASAVSAAQRAAARGGAPAVPRRSASLLLVRDDPLRVLMMRRSSSRGAFPSALVFPGGVLEPGDAALSGPTWGHAGREGGAAPQGDLDSERLALRATAIRETWEEVGVLLARGENGELLTQAAVPTPANAGERGLPGVLRAAGAHLALADVVPFGRWVTPEGGSRRFDTDFFLARAPEGQEPTADGVEALALRWVRPEEAPELREEMLLLPTLMNLKRLGEHETVAEALAAAPDYPDMPVLSTVGVDPDGTPVVRIPPEAGYGISEFYPRDAGHFELER